MSEQPESTPPAVNALVTADQGGPPAIVQAPRPNPFKALAVIFRGLRDALEKPSPDRPARWVRIARARHALVRPSAPAAKDGAIAAASASPEEKMSELIGKLLRAFAESISFIAEAVLDLQELLIQVDATKALFEVSVGLLKTVCEPEFSGAIKELTYDSVSLDLSAIGDVLKMVEDKVDLIPDEKDLECVSHELYLLLRVVHAAGDDGSLDLEGTGKIRLLLWSYGQPYTVRGLGVGESETRSTSHLGARRLGPGAPTKLLRAAVGEHRVLDLRLDGDDDIGELGELLSALGYRDPAAGKATALDAGLVDGLRAFQRLNDLAATGELDDATLDRLHNLDAGRQILARAKPHDAQALADKEAAEKAAEKAPAQEG